MKRLLTSGVLIVLSYATAMAQTTGATVIQDSTSQAMVDTTVTLKQVNYVTFKNPDDQMEFYKDLSRIRAVLPYVKISKRMYAEIKAQKEADSKREYRHYRKDIESEMKVKFEKELKDLTISQGKVMVKLINRETGNNCYHIIKDIKGGFSAWTWQIVARHYSYDLKEEYNPRKDWILELAIKSLGAEYDPN
ncbi:MAG: hypothetical protein JWO03_1948 [Bacteroidetes bacterium]|nr:hypothetical protein [Bacteroidota bacterium]